MQAVSAQFTGQSRGDQGVRSLKDTNRVLMSFTKNFNSAITFFTIGVSTIGGSDIIKGDGSVVQEWDKYDYTDYSGCLMSFQYTREIDTPVGSMVSAMADVVLNNTDKKFTPGFDPVIGNFIEAKRPIKLFTGFKNEPIPVFGGITEKRPVIDTSAKTATFHAIDNMKVIYNTPLDSAVMLTNYRTDTAIAYFLGLAGLSASQYVLDTGTNIIPFIYFPKGALVGDIIKQLVQAELGLFYQDELGIFRFEGRDYAARTADRAISKWSFDKNNCYSISTPDIANVVNVVQITSKVRAVQAKQKLWELQSGVVIPAAVGTSRTNQVTNPNMETSVSGWTGTTATLTQDAVNFYAGTKSLKAVITAINGYAAINLAGLTSGSAYSASARVKATAGKTVFIRFRVGGSVVGTASFTATGGFDNVQVNGITISATTAILEIGCTTTDTLYIDQVLAELGTTPGTYFDGASTATATAAYAWNGTVNLSTSVYTPQGTVDIIADFQDDFGALPVTAVDTPAYIDAATTSYYGTNLAQDGSGSPSNSNVSLFSSTLFATAYLMTFRNSSSVPIYVSSLGIYGTPAKVVNQVYVRKQDDTSVGKYDEQVVTLDNPFIQTEDVANSIAQILITSKKDPENTRTIVVPGIPQLQLGDLVTLNDGVTTNTFYASKIVGTIATDGYKMSITLIKRTIETYFRIGISTIGGADKIAP